MRDQGVTDTVVAEREPVPEREHKLHWWKELLIIGIFYAVYSLIRNQFGSNQLGEGGIPERAFHNAERMIGLERAIGLYHEESIQDWFLPYPWVIRALNIFYGSGHFVVTIGVFLLLFWKRPKVFPQWRNTLAAMTGLAIIGFALFPLMPPRLLDVPCDRYGGACIPSQYRPLGGSFGFVDTLASYGGWWSFDSGAVADLSNQYAAMPSMHIGWAMWCAIAMWPLLSRRWQRVAVFLYPLFTLFVIIVTANHYWIDGVGGLIALGFGALIGWAFHRWNQNRLDRAFYRSLAEGSPRHASLG